MIKFIKFIECRNSEKIWVICKEEDKPSAFLVDKKDLINYLKKADCK